MNGSLFYDKLCNAAEHVKNLGYHPVYVALHGSQNYGLDIYITDYQSGFDYLCVILPRLDDLVKNAKPVSTVVNFEGGHIDIKDIRFYVETIVKMNPAYLESLLTNHTTYLKEGIYVWNMEPLIPKLIQERGLLLVKSIYGMFEEKKKLLERSEHSMKNDHDYDGKQAHHMYRLLLMLRGFDENETISLVPSSFQRCKLLDLKLRSYPYDEVDEMVEAWEIEMNALKEKLEAKYPVVQSNAKDAIVKLSQSAVYDFCCSEEGRKRND